MQEGRRMFQIFAARMFEQRVMTAYREKVAEQRQKQLIEELMEEETRNEQRNAKKAREAQKKKDKKRLQKQAKEEEKARRDAEKAAEEAAAKAAQEKKLEEQRLKREEQRKKREAERKAQEEERARKEAEKQRRLREERERQAEAERKQREQKELERKKREEARRKEREEREAREKKAKEERERKMREEQAKKARESAARAEQEAKEQASKRDAQAKHPGPLSVPPSLHSQVSSGLLPSPLHTVANPLVPKATTPARPRQTSQQGSLTSSPRSQPASTESSHQPSISPRSMPLSQSSGASSIGGKQGLAGPQQPPLHHPQPSAPLSPLGRSHPHGFQGLGSMPSNAPGLPGMAPRPPLAPDLQMYSSNSAHLMNQFRGFPTSSGLPMPPAINGAHPMPSGRGFPPEPGHGLPFQGQHGTAGQFSMQQGSLPKTHSKQPSGSFERSPLESTAQQFPITRQSPIKRPPSTSQDQQKEGCAPSSLREVDALSAQLGSSALLDDTDAPYSSKLSQSLPGATAPGTFPGPTRASFGGPSLLADPLGKNTRFLVSQLSADLIEAPKPVNNLSTGSGVGGNSWGAAFGASAFPGTSTWGNGAG